jgi:hypothetical protein
MTPTDGTGGHAMGQADAFDTRATPDSYVIEHASTALACDPRVGALGIVIAAERGRVIATGNVETSDRERAIRTVLTEMFPEHEVIVDVVVNQTSTQGPSAEELP